MRSKYTEQELIDFWRMDLINDADFAERQAQEGPFYPEQKITPETLLAYAKKCRNEAQEPPPSEVTQNPYAMPS